jgi:hypothetical protein
MRFVVVVVVVLSWVRRGILQFVSALESDGSVSYPFLGELPHGGLWEICVSTPVV